MVVVYNKPLFKYHFSYRETHIRYFHILSLPILMSSLISRLKRSQSDEKDVPTITISLPVNITDILVYYSHGIPKSSELPKDKAVFIPGGLRRGGRYPDIIINKADYSRAKYILHQLFPNLDKSYPIPEIAISKIVDFVRHSFNTEKALVFETKDDYVSVMRSWVGTVDKATKCFINGVYECKEDCYLEKTKYPNTTTNITALPYLIGDCREHAWVSGFLSSVYNELCSNRSSLSCSRQSRIFYNKVYISDDARKKLVFLEEHVFVLFFSANRNVYVIDPLYVETTDVPRIEYNKILVKPVSICQLSDYQGFDQFAKDLCFYQNTGKGNKYQTSIVMECGKIIRSDGSMVRLVNIPIIYDGSTTFTNDTLAGKGNNDIMVLNREMKADNLTSWTSFDEWCR